MPQEGIPNVNAKTTAVPLLDVCWMFCVLPSRPLAFGFGRSQTDPNNFITITVPGSVAKRNGTNHHLNVCRS